MQRSFRETFILIGAPAAVALAILLAGTAIAQTSTETEPAELWPVSECHTATVSGVGRSGVSGSALFCTADDAVRPTAFLSNLTPGQTYGVWLLTSDRPIDVAVAAGHPGAFGRLAEVSAGADGSARVRGHLAGWSVPSGATVTLLVTKQPVGRSEVGSVVAASVFRLP